MQTLAQFAEAGEQGGQRFGAQFRHRVDLHLGQQFVGCLAHTGQPVDRQRRQKIQRLVRLNHKNAVGFTPVRGNFGEEFVGRDAC